jgi:hypothetical protein
MAASIAFLTAPACILPTATSVATAAASFITASWSTSPSRSKAATSSSPCCRASSTARTCTSSVIWPAKRRDTYCGSSFGWRSCGEAWLGWVLVLSHWLGFWWVLITAGSACLYRRRVAGNGAGRGIIFGHRRGRETIFGRVRAGNMRQHRRENFHHAGSRRWSLVTSHRH